MAGCWVSGSTVVHLGVPRDTRHTCMWCRPRTCVFTPRESSPPPGAYTRSGTRCDTHTPPSAEGCCCVAPAAACAAAAYVRAMACAAAVSSLGT
jgi:hypothetical protein